MTRQNLIHKWLTYALGLLPIWILDAYVLPRLHLFGVSPMLLPSSVAAVAVLEGEYGGAGFGLGVGLLWELAYPGGYGLLIFGMTVAGFVAGKATQVVLSQSFPGYVFCSAVTLAMIDVLRVARGLITRTAEIHVLLQVAVPEYLGSLVCCPLIYMVFKMVYERVGGDRLS